MVSVIKGFVTKKDPDQRLPWCAVDIFREGEEKPFTQSHTDAQGEFEFRVPPGSYILFFACPLYEPIRQRVEIGESEEKVYELTTYFMGL